MRSKTSQTERLAAVLKDGRWHSTHELCRRVGLRFSASIHQLKHRYGLVVERRVHPTQSQQYQYRLLVGS